MTLFEFVSVMFSIVLGLSLSHILSGVARLVRGSARASTFAPHTIWVTTLVLMHFLLWWSIWDWRDVEWNYWRFVAASSEPLLLFFMTALILPGSESAGDEDMQAHFLRVRHSLLASFAALVVIFIVDGPIVFGSEGAWSWYRVPQLLALSAALFGLTTENRHVHLCIALVALGVILSGSVFRFLPAAFSIGG